MKRFKRQHNCLFVEEETYNWSTPKNSVNRKLVYLAILFVIGGLVFNALG
ncbi:MAG: hypothetical protein IIC60_01610 [Proteobacteria bacterium]|nr:hypothetical protein [Pseudomonadota bacterium]